MIGIGTVTRFDHAGLLDHHVAPGLVRQAGGRGRVSRIIAAAGSQPDNANANQDHGKESQVFPSP